MSRVPIRRGASTSLDFGLRENGTIGGHARYLRASGAGLIALGKPGTERDFGLREK